MAMWVLQLLWFLRHVWLLFFFGLPAFCGIFRLCGIAARLPFVNFWFLAVVAFVAYATLGDPGIEEYLVGYFMFCVF